MFGNQTPTTGQATTNPAWNFGFATDLPGGPPRGEFYDGFGVGPLKVNQNLSNGGVEGLDAPYATVLEAVPIRAWHEADYHNQLLAGDELFLDRTQPDSGKNNGQGHREIVVSRRQLNLLLHIKYYEKLRRLTDEAQRTRGMPSASFVRMTDKARLTDEMGRVLDTVGADMDPMSAESILSTWQWIGVLDDETKASHNPYSRQKGQRGNNLTLDVAMKDQTEIINVWGRAVTKRTGLFSMLTRTTVINRETGELEFGPFAFVPALAGSRDQVPLWERRYQDWHGHMAKATLIFLGHCRDSNGKGPDAEMQATMLGLGGAGQIEAYEACRAGIKMKVVLCTRFARAIEL